MKKNGHNKTSPSAKRSLRAQIGEHRWSILGMLLLASFVLGYLGRQKRQQDIGSGVLGELLGVVLGDRADRSDDRDGAVISFLDLHESLSPLVTRRCGTAARSA